MRTVRWPSSGRAGAAALVIGNLLWAAPAWTQTADVGVRRAAPAAWTLPRTPEGHPDLQGVWENNTATPLERPEQFAGKTRLTDAELAELQSRVAEVLDGGDALFFDDVIRAALSGNKDFRSFDTTTGNYNQGWVVERVFDHRTSLVTDPPDGRIPALTTEALQRGLVQARYRRQHPADGPEDLGQSTRCISYGLPNLMAGYNSVYQIVQAPDYVGIVMEMVHDARIVPLDGRPRLGQGIAAWHGDSRGHWDGDTLVVETTNFSTKSNFRGSSDGLRLTERFTRVAAGTLEYEVTIDDLSTWTRPWTVMIPLRRTSDPLLEYGCHEGNLGLAGILSGHRAEERASQ